MIWTTAKTNFTLGEKRGGGAFDCFMTNVKHGNIPENVEKQKLQMANCVTVNNQQGSYEKRKLNVAFENMHAHLKWFGIQLKLYWCHKF